jgi:hypothetical protein
MKIWQGIRTGLRRERHALPSRMDAWHRDLAARAIAIARWEDDGGFIGSTRIGPDRPLPSSGPAMPPGARDI